MPRPAYIMFSESGAIDEPSNRVSFFDVVEVIEVVARPAESAPAALPTPPAPRSKKGEKYRVVAVWMRTEGDTPSDVFEAQVACVAPGGADFFQGEVSEVTFEEGIDYRRLLAPDLHVPGFPSVGVFVFEARLRRRGQTEWEQRQQFPFIVREVKPAPTQPLPDPQPA